MDFLIPNNKNDKNNMEVGSSSLSERLLSNHNNIESITIINNNEYNNNNNNVFIQQQQRQHHTIETGLEQIIVDDNNNKNHNTRIGGGGGDGVHVVGDEEGQQQQPIIQVQTQQYSEKQQPNKYRDLWAGILFLFQLSCITYLGIIWGIPVITNRSSIAFYHLNGFISLCIISSMVALLITGCILTIVTRNNNSIKLIQLSLYFSIIVDSIMVLYFSFIEYNVMGLLISIIAIIYIIIYSISIWRRIPYTAMNIQTAVIATVQTNGSIVFIAYGITILVNILYVLLWILAYIGIYARHKNSSSDNNDNNNGILYISHTNPMTILVFLLSFYWTMEVGKNIIHVTVAGVVGTWWFVPYDANSFFSLSTIDSFMRAMKYSFGSICLGSFITAFIQLLYHILYTIRRNHNNHIRYCSSNVILCISECILGFLERLVAYFNKWAYVYIGLYGYDYLTAGKKVHDLFVARGWTTIINDDLVHRVLVLMSFVIGIVTGGIGILLASVHPNWVAVFGSSSSSSSLSSSWIIPFLIPFMIGTSISYIMMGIISSAVDTVIVAFCEAPLELERNHPGLYIQMANAWSRIYPQEFRQ